jgi:hypothetical protein
VMETNRLPDLIKHLTEGNAALIVQNDNLKASQRAKAVFSLHMALDGNPHVVEVGRGTYRSGSRGVRSQRGG